MNYRYNWIIHYNDNTILKQNDNGELHLFKEINKDRIDYVEIIDSQSNLNFSYKLPSGADLIIFERHGVGYFKGYETTETTQFFGYKIIINERSCEWLMKFFGDKVELVIK